MRTVVLALLLAAIVSDADARSRDYRSYRFYRDFYERHRGEGPARRPQWGVQPPLPYWDCDYSAVNLFGGQRRITRWICINPLEER
jgi:hypothetical protein